MVSFTKDLETCLKTELEGNENKSNCLVTNFCNKLKYPALFSPPVSHGEKCGKFQFVVKIAQKPVVLILISL